MNYFPPGGYKTSDLPNPRGEIWISGANVAAGYYNNSDQTLADFHAINGKKWFSTGDIGEFHKDGTLEIIGLEIVISKSLQLNSKRNFKNIC